MRSLHGNNPQELLRHGAGWSPAIAALLALAVGALLLWLLMRRAGLVPSAAHTLAAGVRVIREEHIRRTSRVSHTKLDDFDLSVKR